VVRDHVHKETITNHHELSSLSDSLFNSSHMSIVNKGGMSFGSFLGIRPQTDDLISCCLWPRLGSPWWGELRNRVRGKNDKLQMRRGEMGDTPEHLVPRRLMHGRDG